MIDKILPLLRELLDEARAILDNAHFTTSRQHILSGALLGRLLEIADGIYVTLERRNPACGYILLRSLLEGYADLRNLTKTPEYDELMHATWLKQQQHVLENALEKGIVSTFFTEVADHPNARARLDSTRVTLKQLKNRGVKPLEIRDRFERAELLNYYYGPYNDLSCKTHGNLPALEERHIRFAEHGVEVRVFDAISDSDAQIISDMVARFVADSARVVCSMLRPDGDATELEQLSKKLARLRACLSQEDQ